MPYLEEQLGTLVKDFNDFRVEMADRLGRIENEQSNTNQQLLRMNGTVASTESRVRVLENERVRTGEQLADALQSIASHETDIGKLKGSEFYAKGKMAGIGVAASALTNLLWFFGQWFFHRK